MKTLLMLLLLVANVEASEYLDCEGIKLVVENHVALGLPYHTFIVFDTDGTGVKGIMNHGTEGGWISAPDFRGGTGITFFEPHFDRGKIMARFGRMKIECVRL